MCVCERNYWLNTRWRSFLNPTTHDVFLKIPVICLFKLFEIEQLCYRISNICERTKGILSEIITEYNFCDVIFIHQTVVYLWRLSSVNCVREEF